jgi:hypothetical protein
MSVIAPSSIIPKALPKALPRQDARPVKAPVARLVNPQPKLAGLLEDPPPPVQQVQFPAVPAQPAQAPPVIPSPAPTQPQSGKPTASDKLTRSHRKPVKYDRLPSVDPSANIDIDTLRFNKPVVSNEEGDMVY